MGSPSVLKYEKEILASMKRDDGLLVMAHGLGLHRIISVFVNALLSAPKTPLVFVLNADPRLQNHLIDAANRSGRTNALPAVITTEYTPKQRVQMYRHGGLYFITARIMVVDLLKFDLDPNLISALLICNAHQVRDMAFADADLSETNSLTLGQFRGGGGPGSGSGSSGASGSNTNNIRSLAAHTSLPSAKTASSISAAMQSSEFDDDFVQDDHMQDEGDRDARLVEYELEQLFFQSDSFRQKNNQLSFILKLVREANKSTLIKAFTDNPEAIVSNMQSFSSLAVLMKNLFVSKVWICPRFLLSVRDALETTEQSGSDVSHTSDLSEQEEEDGGQQADVLEIEVQYSPLMTQLERCIVSLLRSLCRELKKANKFIRISEDSIDNYYRSSVFQSIRSQAAGQVHRMSGHALAIFRDIGVVERMGYYLTKLDSVQFYGMLIMHRASQALLPGDAQAVWLYYDDAETLLLTARARVYTREQGPEINPKWQALLDQLAKITQSKRASSSKTLVLVQGYDTLHMLRQILNKGPEHVLKRYLQQSEAVASQITRMNHPESATNELQDSLKPQASPSEAKPQGDDNTQSAGRPRSYVPPSKRFKAQKALQLQQRAAKKIAEHQQNSSDQSSGPPFLLTNEPLKDAKDHNVTDMAVIEGKSSFDVVEVTQQPMVILRDFGDPESPVYLSELLAEIRPDHLILYDPTLEAIREIECYNAMCPTQRPKVYMLSYGDSIEKQRFLNTVEREALAFKKLIHEKEIMLVPKEQEGKLEHIKLTYEKSVQEIVREQVRLLNSSKNPLSGNTDNPDCQLKQARQHQNKNSYPSVVVDVREFRSALPSILYAERLFLVPMTFQIGDYVLSPEVCVERKSMADLIASFQSGRLYDQVAIMTRAYQYPILLLEFDGFSGSALAVNHGPSLQGQQAPSVSSSFASVGGLSSNTNDLDFKLCLLLLKFPSLRLIWSHSAQFSAKMFKRIKETFTQEPDPDHISRLGENALMASGGGAGVQTKAAAYNHLPEKILRTLPGVNELNYRVIMNSVASLSELSRMSLKAHQDLIGEGNGRILNQFLNKP